jgi:hypothetical protein
MVRTSRDHRSDRPQWWQRPTPHRLPAAGTGGVRPDVQPGQVTTVILSVGGFLGMDTKDVAAPFKAIHATMKDNKWWLAMNTTKDALKTAPGYKYDTKSTFRTNPNRHHIVPKTENSSSSAPASRMIGGRKAFLVLLALFSFVCSKINRFA